MKTKKISAVRIVGGGSAGWMTAAVLAIHFPHFDIRVIEDPNTPHIGVGESTLGQFRNFLNLIGVRDDEFMKDCDASYKLGIRFKNFYLKNNEHFFYPFGKVNLNGNQYGLQDWNYKKIFLPDTPLSDYANCMSPIMALINANKIFKNENNELPNFDFTQDVAFHFDSLKFANWLKEKICLPRGVTFVPQKLTKVKINEEGIYEYELDGQHLNKLKADLFIDCTGFKSLLLGEYLQEPFESYEDLLPNNSAWATRIPYKNKEKELVTYTDCEAIDNGWVWTIPLWSRLGCGYVYSNKFIDDNNALIEFKKHLITEKKLTNKEINKLEFKKIPMRIGIHKRLWVKNVVAIGLSAGFIEPLESNGLYTVHEFLIKLCKILKRDYVSQWDRDNFNMACHQEFYTFAQFVALHYALSHRTDTEYWRAINNKSFYKNMNSNDTPFSFDLKFISHVKMKHANFNTIDGVHYIATGMNYLSSDLPTVLHQGFEVPNYRTKDVEAFYLNLWHSSRKNLEDKKKTWKEAIKKQPSLFKFLTKYIYKKKK
jgi:tryptophan halogenase